MKWKFKTIHEKLADRIEKTCKWHAWFAWYPVVIASDNAHYKVWMQYVGRKNKIYSYADEQGRRTYVTYPCKYCDKQDLVIKALNDNELEDATDGRYKEFLEG